MAYFRILKIYSPDLSPIENIWAILKKPVKDQLNERQVKRKDQHWKLCKEFWNQIPLSTFQKAIESMPKRWDSVIKNCGGNINKLFIKQVNQQEPFVPHCTSNLNLLICDNYHFSNFNKNSILPMKWLLFWDLWIRLLDWVCDIYLKP